MTNLNDEPGIHLFWTSLYLIASARISRVFLYSVRYSSSKKLNLHSPNLHGNISVLSADVIVMILKLW